METSESMHQYLAAIVEGSDDAIITKGLDSIIRSWNPGAERLFGYSAEEAIGQPITMLFPADREDEETDFIARLSRGERIAHFETIRKRKDGSLIPISLTVSPVRNAAGKIVGASKIARDISVQRAAEERQELRARESEALLAVAQKLLEDVSFDEFAQFCLDAVCNVVGMNAGHLLFAKGRGENARLHPSGIWYITRPGLQPVVDETERLTFASGEGLPGLAWKFGELKFLNEVDSSPHFLRRQVFKQVGLASAVALPIWQGGEIKAVLEFFGSQKAKLDADILRMLSTVGSQIGIAIHQKQEAEHRETLRREMSHRVGNSLSVLASIYRSCSRAASNKDELDEAFLGRIVAVGHANRVAIENATQGASLNSLIVDSIEIFPAQDRIELDVIDLHVGYESVMPIALILNELATNALKHNEHFEKIQLKISASYCEATEQVVLKWFERRAAPLVAPPNGPTRVGFGTQLIKLMVENKLGGQLDRHIDESGLSCVFRVPRNRIEN
ncbi:PAS domain-containing sensor histidine kinase [Neptunicoccus sediminis]|uniref:PAS domain-containing sensor histidine kinase n=1 Tax=Neptunicoccus sediminis TaxID=1892596 RepID=UPI001C12A1FE|nr:PAS domain S-box protein [Neptunicoccus sediminis]